ncbi:hypothetical protein CIL03_12015 [Virgibacillus indicus]|uniref:AlgX/AlgJ SGNH hydrolase-like domain-containing protein n=1 Tax=Virgibacillus indicus TaxID=2024554 RepID=A0A265NA88_9BACI|nr:DHHW family protein [Virgibacillus indicus]OZU88369.1 hypothetical protein CIL03_12015 [Virgibacillus indicus]
MKISIGELIVVIFFLSFIFLFSIWSVVKGDETNSVIENRKLDQRPDATLNNVLSGEYFKRFESYYNDQFPLRSEWIETKNTFEKTVFQQNLINSTFVHDDGYLIPTLVTNENNLKPENIAERINSFASNIKNKDVDIFFALAPNKTTMMEHKLPDYISSEANKLSDQLIKELLNIGKIKTVDLRDAIKPHLVEKNLYFYTDHHWKPKAAFYGYRTIISKIQESNDILNPLSINDFSWEESNVKFLGSDARNTTESYVKYPDTVTIAKPKFEEKKLEICYRGNCNRSFYDYRYLELPDKYTNRYKVYFSGDVPEGIIRNPNVSNDHKLLILKDSYANTMIQFLARNYSETRILDMRHYDKKSVYQYIEDNNITEVLFLHNINSLVTTPSLTNFNNTSK